jgi:N-acetylmuramic acid 6-phosphate etherase
MMTVLEMVARELLATDGVLGSEFDASDRVPHTMAAALERLHASLADAPLREALAVLVEGEERIYKAGARTSYLASALGVDVLTDTTERSPTYCTPSFRKWDDAEAAESWAALFTDKPITEDAWPALLRREPQTIEWTQDELRTLLDDDAAERQGAVLREINRREFFRFRIGLDGLAYRPVRAGDGVTAVLTDADLPLVEGPGGAFAALLASANATGAATSVLGVGTRGFLDRLAAAAEGASVVTLQVPDVPFLLDPMARIGVKMVLNALSTCVMVRLGRVLGNRMICLVPSNLKLIDRSTRYIRDLAEVPYDDACRALFDVIHYVDPRRQAGKAYPAPVGVATMHLRHGLDLPAAEARLYEELK